MNLLWRTIQRIIVFGIGIFIVWLCLYVVFPLIGIDPSLILMVIIFYALLAYVLLLYFVRLITKIRHLYRAPRYTITGDGLPSDPINIVLKGNYSQLRKAFAAAGWTEAETLNFKSSVKMAKSFIFKKPYPNAPFSTLFLFGRGQDIGFEKAIGDDPRKRHHIRFWGKDHQSSTEELNNIAFWIGNDAPKTDKNKVWVGAGTKDTGFAFAKITMQITHATDDDTNTERDYIVKSLSANNSISKPKKEVVISDGHQQVNQYITDGRVTVAELICD